MISIEGEGSALSECHTFINPCPRGRRVTVLSWFVCVCVCVCVCLLPQNCCLSSIISKSKPATALSLCKQLAILLFYKAAKFLKAQATQTAQKI